MKTFRDCSIKDTVYYCKEFSIDYKPVRIVAIKNNLIELDEYSIFGGVLQIRGSQLDLERFGQREQSKAELVFLIESQAIRYCKSNLLRELRKKIEAAKKAIHEVVQFRLDNIDHLNKDWIEDEILKLERQEREML